MYYTDSLEGLVNPPEAEWRPVYWTEMKRPETLGDAICDFMEEYLEPPRLKTDDWKVLPWQRWLMQHVYELKEDGSFRYKEVYIFIPRKEGKSFFASSNTVYHCVKGREGDQILVAAKTAGQARIVFDEAVRQVTKSRKLQLVLDSTKDEIKNKFKTVTIRPLSSDAKNSFGLAPYFSVGDELWAWDTQSGQSSKGKDMLASLTTGSGDRDEAMFMGISTAGTNLEGLAYQNFEKGKLITTGAFEDDSFGFFVWQAEDHDDISDPETWMKANPNLRAGVKSMENFKEKYEAATLLSTADFERYNLNKWLRGGDREDFIAQFYWGEIEKPELGKIPEGARIAVGFDGSLTEDSTGIIGIDLATGLIEVLHGWEKDPTDPDWFVDVGEVDQAMHDVHKKYDVAKVYCDPSRHQEVVKGWQRAFGAKVVRDIPPTAVRMAPMSEVFRSDIYTEQLFHAGEKRLTNHVKNAVLNMRGLPQKDAKGSVRKIDFLVCAILANGARHEVLDAEAKAEAARLKREKFLNS